MTPLERRKPPHHPVNAMLNYAYAVLERATLE
jgi:CRISPR/Cas system-associated endonuclease Cas1